MKRFLIDAMQHASFESECKPETRMFQFDCKLRNEFGIPIRYFFTVKI